MPTRLLAPVVAVAALALGPASAAENVSTYTRHDFERCAKTASAQDDPVVTRTCKGVAGVPVVWTAEPDSSSVAFGTRPATTESIPGLDTFFEARGTIEWRGPMVGTAIRPVAAIVRYDTGRSVGRLRASRLVVYRLAPDGTACVIRVVKGSAAEPNATARAIVDREAARFVCGKAAEFDS